VFKVFDLTSLAYGSYLLTLCSLILMHYVFIFIGAGFFIFTINKILKSYLQNKNVDNGRSYIIRTIIHYITYTITFILVLKSLDAQVAVQLLGSAGLLVGIGLCLQHTFLDFLHRLILWVKGNIEKEDGMDIDDNINQVTIISSRTCSIKTKEYFTIITHNSKLLKQHINRNHNNALLIFEKLFGISYKSYIDPVQKITHKEIKKDADVVLNPASAFQLINFGASLFNFGQMFCSDNLFRIEKVKSIKRKNIFKELRIKGVEISRLQRDIWLK